MNYRIANIGIVSAILAFLLCFLAGIWLLSVTGFKSNDDGIWTTLGLYFLGKAFFIGPMLLVASYAFKQSIQNNQHR